jgi:hypothetical protein
LPKIVTSKTDADYLIAWYQTDDSPMNFEIALLTTHATTWDDKMVLAWKSEYQY